MSVTKEEVVRIAELARLELDDREAELLRGDLSGILSHMETLGEVPADAPDSAVRPHRDGAAPMREDGVVEPDRLRRSLDSIAPSRSGGFFIVPRLPGLEAESGGRDEPDPEEPDPDDARTDGRS